MKKNLIFGTLIGGIFGAIILSGLFYVDSVYANYRPNHDRLVGMIMCLILGFPIGMGIGFRVAKTNKKKRDKKYW